jgi:outer membrane protein OmpA-like peptidoglycan-associated protein
MATFLDAPRQFFPNVRRFAVMASRKLRLAQRRSEAVFSALVYTNHVPENRVELRWTGERLPYLSTEDEKEEMLNRVVEIIVR